MVLGGGAAALGLLAWKMFKVPLPEEEASLPEEAEEEAISLLEEAGEDEED